MQHYELLIFFLAVAFVYASVGFGGGSSYLAILSFYALPFQEMKLTALICNIVVVTGGTIIYVQKKQLDLKKASPIVFAGLPMAFWGGRMKLEQDTFFILLGFSLLVAAVLLWIKNRKAVDEEAVPERKFSTLTSVFFGGAIGLLSGMVGIGGGIFLAPILNLARWDTPKKIAATASLYILVNSISGIAGQLSRMPAGINYVQVALLGATVLAGGQLGSRMGAVKFNQLVVRRVTALLVFVAGIEVLYKHIHWLQ